jgi:SAM-dependent methyltransferase
VSPASHPTATRALQRHCPVCDAVDFPPPAAGAACPACDASFPAQVLASGVLRHVTAGCVPALRRAAGSAQVRSLAILDLSGEKTIAAAFGALAGYRALPRVEWDAGQRAAAAPILPYRDGLLDAVIARDVLAAHGRTARAVAEIARVLKPGGVAIFQERFAWPLPETGGRSPRGVPIIGADIGELFQAAGMIDIADRPCLPLAPDYREMLLVAFKVV